MTHDPYYEPVQVIKSFRMGTGKPTANICERVIKKMVEEKNHELYEQNPKGPKTRFAGEVIVTVDAAVRVNLYHAIDKDAVNFGVYYEQMRREKL